MTYLRCLDSLLTGDYRLLQAQIFAAQSVTRKLLRSIIDINKRKLKTA